MSKEKGGGGGGDELDELKAKILAKEMELLTERDNMRRLQERSVEIELHIDKIANKSRDKIKSLEDIISLINTEGKVKEKRIVELEGELAKLKEESEATIKKLSKEMENATSSFEFKYESLKLQYEASQIRLRELHEFGVKKAALEKELVDTRHALLKERESKIEMVGDAERASYAAQEKMRRQMETIVAETEARMTKSIELQLHTKTKKTIIENEQLKEEVQYHTQATMVLYKENERLREDNHEQTRTITLLKEMKAELELKNMMYQKTLRILVHKLREKEHQLTSTQERIKAAMTDEKRQDEEDFQELLLRAENLKELKGPLPRQAVANGQSQKSIQVSALEFLYACLEDMELETFTKVAAESPGSSSVPFDMPLDQLNMKQRHDLLKSLLKRATAVRVMTQSLTNASSDKALPRHVPYTPVINQSNPGGNIVFDVQDVLALPIGQIMASEPGDRSHQKED